MKRVHFLRIELNVTSFTAAAMHGSTHDVSFYDIYK